MLVVYIGETSSGKSSIINAIIGEKILPTGIMATPTRVCRVRYSKELNISLIDDSNKIYKEYTTLESTKDMAEKLTNIAQTNNLNITYVDISMPVPFQEVIYLYLYF